MTGTSISGNMWLILNELGNVIDAKIETVNEDLRSIHRKKDALLVEKEQIAALRAIELRLSKKGLI